MKEVTARRRQAEREERSSSILNAARKVFYKEGYFGTTIRKIAYEAELSQGAIYRFFKGIDEIYAELLLDQFQIIDRVLEKGIAEGESPTSKIKCMAQRYFEYYLAYPESYDLFLFGNVGWRRVGLKQELVKRLDEALSGNLRFIEVVLAEGITQGTFEISDSRKMAYLLWTAIEGMIVNHRRNMLENAGWDIRELVEDQVDLLLNGILVR